MSGPERRLEAACCTLARRARVQPLKLGGFAVGLPDRIFLLPGGRTWLVEFKSPTGRISPAQCGVFAALARIGHPVSVIRSKEAFKAGLKAVLDTGKAPPYTRFP